MDAVTPSAVYSRSFPNVGELNSFLEALTDANVETSSIQLFLLLAGMSPPDRLEWNLKSVMELFCQGDISSAVLTDGLFAQEKQALIDLDKSGVPVRYREIGHGLLNVHERWLCMRALGKSFREARENKTQFLKRED